VRIQHLLIYILFTIWASHSAQKEVFEKEWSDSMANEFLDFIKTDVNHNGIWATTDRVTREGKLTTCGKKLLKRLHMMDQDAIKPFTINSQFANNKTVPETELYLTKAFFTFMNRLYNGSINPKLIHSTFTPHTANHLIISDHFLVHTLKMDKQCRFLDDPLFERDSFPDQYVELKKLYQSLYPLAKQPWPVIPNGIKRGDRNDSVIQLKEILAAFGDLNNIQPSNNVFDDTVIMAIQRFQKRHKINMSGILDPQTLSFMNEKPLNRLRRLAINLERWRWYPKNKMNKQWIVVNIPAQELMGFTGGIKDIHMKIVIGKKVNATPILVNNLIQIMFNPVWGIPTKAIYSKILPSLKKNKAYLESQKIVVFDDQGKIIHHSRILNNPQEIFHLIQKPGPQNPLGKMLFLLDNPLGIHLHDTPQKDVFNFTDRELSLGCIRLQHASVLYAWLSEHPNLKKMYVVQGAKTATETSLWELNQPLPIWVGYWTIWIDHHNAIEHHAKDRYGYDALMMKYMWPSS
jgi:murein L,D-transpeptidase YcbB/YkuD